MRLLGLRDGVNVFFWEGCLKHNAGEEKLDGGYRRVLDLLPLLWTIELLWEMIQFDEYFSSELKPPSNSGKHFSISR